MNVQESTVNKNFCSGCGVCSASCPIDAIKMTYTETKEYRPVIDGVKCTGCGICVQVCPNSYDNKTARVKLLAEKKDPGAYGIENNTGCFRCLVRDKDALMRSASGGFVTAFAQRMLKEKLIDCVIHAMPTPARTGEEHYISVISRTPDELEQGRSSIYGPVCFDQTLREFVRKDEKILFIGTPCAITGVKNLFAQLPQYRNNTLYTVALCCSHNATGQFVDFLADIHDVPRNQAYSANLRAKHIEMADSSHFYTNLFTSHVDIVMEDRNTFFTPLWRSYCFAMQACNHCPDFWGADADVSVKDAWGHIGHGDRYGSNIVIFRNRELTSLFLQMHELEITKLSYIQVHHCQLSSSQYKQVDIHDRFGRDVESLEGHEAYKKNVQNADLTARYYLEGGCREVRKRVIDSILLAFHHSQHPTLWLRLQCAVGKTLRLFQYKKRRYRKILMMSGFGGDNAGDEAQIDAAVKIMQRRYPRYWVKVLTSVPIHTWSHHHCIVGDDLPRINIWDMDTKHKGYLFGLKDSSFFTRVRFLWKGYWVCLNAYLVRMDLPTFLLSAKRAAFLQDLKTSDLLYFSGSGCMTGVTLSRLWDFMFCMKMARILKVPCVLSGQNSGLWGSKFTEKLVAKELKHAKAVTLRDAYAVENLKKIGVEGNHVFTMFDDALFCEKMDDVGDYLRLYGIEEGPYIAMHLHYYGADSKAERSQILERFGHICDVIHEKTGMKILLIPMASGDSVSMEDFVGIYQKNFVKVARFEPFEYDFKLIRGLFANAFCCVTMKHHPIIFSLGEGVPVISIAYKPYHVYKNKGALELFELGKYNLNLEDRDYLGNFTTLFYDIYENREMLAKTIRLRLDEIKPRREMFLKIVDKILEF